MGVLIGAVLSDCPCRMRVYPWEATPKNQPMASAVGFYASRHKKRAQAPLLRSCKKSPDCYYEGSKKQSVSR